MERIAFAAGLFVALAPAQTLTLGARAATDLVVATSTEISGSSSTVPAGTVLTTGTLVATTPSLFGDACLLSAALGPTGEDFLLSWYAHNSQSRSVNSSSGDVLMTLVPPPATAVAAVLHLTYVGTTDFVLGATLRGEIDLNADGSVELLGTGPVGLRQTVPAVVSPAGMSVRVSIPAVTTGASGNHSVQLHVDVEEVLAVTATTYEAGCGPALDVAPTPQSQLEVAMSGLSPTGLSVLLIGFARDHVALPCGGCTLGVRVFEPLALSSTSSGARTVFLSVPPALLPIQVDLQVASLDPSPCAVATSDALEVRLSR